MNCLNREKIQRYLDKEFNERDHFRIQEHLKICTECFKKYQSAFRVKSMINRFINEVFPKNNEITIPDFYPIIQKYLNMN